MRAGSCPARFALSVCLLLLAPAMSKPAAGGDAGAQAAVLLEFTAPAVVLRGVRTPVPFYLQVAGLPVNSSLFVEVRATRRDPGDTSPAAFGSFEAVVRGSGVFEVEDSVDMVSDPSLADFDVALLVRDGPNGTILTMATERPVRAIPSFLSILPAFLIVTVAIVTRNVVIALLAGLTLGGIFISPGFNPIGGLMRAGDTFLYGGVRDADMGLILFTWFMSGLVGLISRNGGAMGLGRRFGNYATTARSAQAATCAAGLLIFFDDYASILIVGSTLRPVTDAAGVSREKLAYITDTTAAPVASVALLSTWVGFKLSVVQQQLDLIGVNEVSPQHSALSILIRGLPLCLYPLLAVAFVCIVAATGRDFGPMAVAERRARRAHLKRSSTCADASRQNGVRSESSGMPPEDAEDVTTPAEGSDLSRHREGWHATCEEAAAVKAVVENPLAPLPGKPVRSVNALLPIAVMVVGMIYGTISSGIEQHYLEVGPLGPEPGAVDVLGKAETTKVLIWGSLLACAVAVMLSLVQRILTVEQCMDAWVTGIREVTLGLITLIFAWGVGNMSRQINVGGFVSSAVGEHLDPVFIAPAGFFLAACVSIASGSSWGAMVLLFPILLPLAVHVQTRTGDPDNGIVVECVAAVLSGAIVGDHISPISDTTVLASVSAGCPIYAHVETQAPYAFLVAIVALVLTCVASLLSLRFPGSLALAPLGVALLAAALRTFGTDSDAAPGRGGATREDAAAGVGDDGAVGRDPEEGPSDERWARIPRRGRGGGRPQWDLLGWIPSGRGRSYGGRGSYGRGGDSARLVVMNGGVLDGGNDAQEGGVEMRSVRVGAGTGNAGRRGREQASSPEMGHDGEDPSQVGRGGDDSSTSSSEVDVHRPTGAASAGRHAYSAPSDPFSPM